MSCEHHRITRGTDKSNVLCSNSSSRKTIRWLNAERFNIYPVLLDSHSQVCDI